ncbi:MAG: hypothetical protein SFY32_05375 [Bacteroidota bacterium]|nr:hypothetical protein [Bacteroidota bacterium]
MKRIIAWVFLLFMLINCNLFAQEITWASMLLKQTKKFESDNNLASFAIGVPSIYPDTNLYSNYDPYCEGFLLMFKNTSKLNTIRVGYTTPTKAQQLILGGVFNPGTIVKVSALLEDGREKILYTFNEKNSIVKFNNYHIFFEACTIMELEITFNHMFINKWNLLKGIGLANWNEPLEITAFEGDITGRKIIKQSVDGDFKKDGCYIFAPKISTNGQRVYFVKECPNSDNGQDIWYADIDDLGKWNEPKNIGFPLNNSSHNYVASAGSSFLLVGNKYKPDGSYGGEGVSITKSDSLGKWMVPKEVAIPDYINNNEHSNFFMTDEQDILIIAAEDDRSFGDLDLYVSLKDDQSGKWSKSINLGEQINTTFSEDYPYLAKDGVTLYFSSKGHIGYGGYDIYMTKRLDDTWKNWTKPINLGSQINTKTDDKSFVISSDGTHAYLNSQETDNLGIYKIDLSPEFYQINEKPIVKVTGSKKPMRFEVK